MLLSAKISELLATRPLLTTDGAVQMAAWQTSLSATINNGGSRYDDGQLRVRADFRPPAPVLSLYSVTCHRYHSASSSKCSNRSERPTRCFLGLCKTVPVI